MFSDQQQYVKYLQITSDLICYVLLYLIFVPAIIQVCTECHLLFSSSPNLAENICIYKSPHYLGGSLILLLISLGASGLAAMAMPLQIRWNTAKAVIPLCLSLLSGTLLWALLRMLPISRDQLPVICTVAAAVLFLCMIFNRINIYFLLFRGRAHSFLIHSVAIVGTGPESKKLARHIDSHPETGLRFAGFVTPDNRAIQKSDSHRVLATITDLPSVLHRHGVGMVFVPTPKDLGSHACLLFKICSTMGIELCCLQRLHQIGNQAEPMLDTLGELPVFRYRFVSIAARSAFIKRIFDFTGSTFLIVACLPFWIVVPLMIKSDSRGPVFFRQERIGKYGRKFILYKFRSMHEKAEAMQEYVQHLNEMDGPAFKIKNDPRQTSTGRLLRKYSLDELPQLFNVFKGEISLVGPRPAIEEEVMQYRPAELRRLSVVQGITCVWQISGRNEIKFDEWMKLDRIYIDHWSSVSDVKILFKTIPAVLMKRGAY